jgi:hypothetical protein
MSHEPHLSLWRGARHLLAWFFTLFGAPEDVAAERVLRAERHKQFAAWLRAGEAIMRRLLLIEAAALPRPNLEPPRPRTKRARVKRIVGFYPERPEEWRVSFRLSEDRRLLAGSKVQKHSRSKEAQRFRNAWPLAERYEALIRAFNDPAPYARRLARRLYAKTDRVLILLRRWRQPAGGPAEDWMDEAAPILAPAAARFIDST